jgi:hypothetical protein
MYEGDHEPDPDQYWDMSVEEFVDRRKLFTDEDDASIIAGMEEEGLLYTQELVSAMKNYAERINPRKKVKADA